MEPELTIEQCCDLAGSVLGRRPAPNTVRNWLNVGVQDAAGEYVRMVGRCLSGKYWLVRKADLVVFLEHLARSRAGVRVGVGGRGRSKAPCSA